MKPILQEYIDKNGKVAEKIPAQPKERLSAEEVRRRSAERNRARLAKPVAPDKVFQMIALTAYLSDNGSALSTDVIFSYFSPITYNYYKQIIEKTKTLLNQTEELLSEDEMDQDYFILRSKLFTHHAIDLLKNDNTFKHRYTNIIKQFILMVRPHKILRYDIFRRSAFDSSFFFNLY